MQKGAVGVVTALALTTSAAFAGEVLRLQSGSIRIQNEAESLLQDSFNLTDAQESRYFVVQFKEAIRQEDRASLARRGFEVERYLPDDALVIKGTAQDAGFLGSTDARVRAIVPFSAEWKVSADLREPTQEASEWLHVALLSAADERAVHASLKAIPGVDVRRIAPREYAVQANRALAPQFAAIEGVEWVQTLPLFVTFDYQVFGAGLTDENNGEVKPADGPPALTGFESGTKVMNFDEAWARGFTGTGQTVGMADTGLDTGDVSKLHKDLSAVTKGYAMGTGSSSWEDPQGHGTHVSGSVVGSGNASDGKIRGGAHGAKFLATSLWSPLFNNIMLVSDFNKLFGTPYNDGARIHTNSWGSPKNLGVYDTFARKSDDFMWNNPDMLILFAAGNSGQDADKDGRVDEGSVSSPGTAKNVLTVGASENLLTQGGIQKKLGELNGGTEKWGVAPLKDDLLSNNINGIAAFSSRGPTQDGRIKPEVVAPGTNIVSTRSHHPSAGKLWGAYNDEYLYAGGTSMATPLTAGAAAVTREFLVKNRGVKNPSGALVKATLIHTATDLFPGQYGEGQGQELTKQRPNVHEGYGRVNVDLATRLDASTVVLDEVEGVGLKQEKSVTIDLREGESVRATLVYTDAPGSPTAAKALVNELSLRVVDPANGVTRVSDTVNNTRMIEIQAARAGRYSVVVRGENVPEGKRGKQPFALLVTHGS